MKTLLKTLFLFTFISACSNTKNNLNTDDLSQVCKNNLLNNEFLVKFKHEDKYRSIPAKSAQNFLNSTIKPMKSEVEAYGLNFKFSLSQTQENHLNLLLDQKKFNPEIFKPWVQSFSRSKFLTSKGYQGQNVRIAVLDTGIDLQAPVFANNLIKTNKDILGKNIAENNFDVQDINGHGTQVSSLIAAPQIKSQENFDFEGGLAQQAQILPVKIFSADTRTTKLNVILEALDYAMSQKVQIINASWGGSENCSSLLKDKIYKLWANNILFITSAGDSAKNLSEQADFPASFDIPVKINVSAINKQLEVPSRANYGGTINLWAPGQDVPVIGLTSQLQLESGTSLAAGISSGGAALLMSAFPELSAKSISKALSIGSRYNNPTAIRNTIDLKSSYFYLQSRGFLATSPL